MFANTPPSLPMSFRKSHLGLDTIYGLFLKGAIISICVLVSGCFTPSAIPVTNRTSPEKITTGYHRVRAKESLSGIAHRYGWDYKELALVNRIRYPYKLYPNQKIYFHKRVLIDAEQRRSTKKQTTPTKKRQKYIKNNVKGKVSLSRNGIQWSWPFNGPLLSDFSNSGNVSVNKGIDIGGKQGQAIKAAAKGVVVYAGNGLRGYGNLIIVKHNVQYLSAYAYNKALLVQEGDKVKAGQSIATMGTVGNQKNRLHFEIRSYGKPVNPLKYLPNR